MRRILSKRIWMVLGSLVLVAGLAMVAVGLFTLLDEGDSGRAATQPTTDTGLYVRETTAPPTTTPSPAATKPPLARDAPYNMIIDKIGVNTPVVTYGLDPNGIPLVPTGPGAADVVAWYDFSAVPGSGSNAVFAGHVNWDYADAVFAHLEDLQVGDTIRLKAEDGTELVYAVSNNLVVDREDPSALQLMQSTPTDTITLITCGGTWIPDTSAQFGGNYTNRVVVRATLLSITTVASQQSPAAGG